MNFDLPERTILLVVAGSRAYGVNTPESDVDVKGICIPPWEVELGYLHRFAQAGGQEAINNPAYLNALTADERVSVSQTKLEGEVYHLRRFIELAVDSNPNILDVLFCRDEEVRLLTPMGSILRGHRDLFLSTKARFTFTGYAVAQIERIETHRKYLLDPPKALPLKEDFGLIGDPPVPPAHLAAAKAALQKKLDSWEMDLSHINRPDRLAILEKVSGMFSEFIDNGDDKWTYAARSLGFDANLIEYMANIRRYDKAVKHWKAYLSWQKERNVLRSGLEEKYGYDTKHASHVFRLLNMSEEILSTGKVNVYRGGIDADEILAIRRGAWKFDDLLAYAKKKLEIVDAIYLAGTSKLKRDPDRKMIDWMCAHLMRSAMNPHTNIMVDRVPFVPDLNMTGTNSGRFPASAPNYTNPPASDKA